VDAHDNPAVATNARQTGWEELIMTGSARSIVQAWHTALNSDQVDALVALLHAAAKL
jgi:hypothetical protein